MIFVFFIFAFNLFCNILSQIVFDFEKKYKTFNKDNFSEYISNNKLITKVTLGTPKQEIPIEIDFKEHYFYITDKIVNGIYDSTKSSSYINTSKSNSYGFDNIKECYTSFESFYFNNYTKKEFLSKNDFLLITKTKKQNDEELSKLGLTLISYMEFYKYNLIYILKQNKTINSIIFYFEYLTDSKGKLYIGTEPHNIQKNMFSNQNYKTKYLDLSDSINWLFNFNNISFYNISIASYRQIKFDANFNGIFPPTNIKEEIKEKAFNKLIEDKICSIESNDKFEYSFFVCEKNFEIEKFQSLTFYLNDFNFTFTLTYEDLFIKNNNRYYCLILYENKTLFGRMNWVIGEVFLKKYFIVFNQEKQMIGFYTKLNTSINLPISWILVFIFVTISLILVIIVYKLLNQKKRKIRANELEEDIEYVQKI
jgi:hypothetical protein